MNFFNITRAHNHARTKGYDKLYWLIDLHDTIIPGNFTRNNEGRRFFSLAKEVLSNLSKNPRMVLILWTSSHEDSIKDICQWMESYGIKFKYVNENPDFKNTELCNFEHNKLAFDIGLDDKFGFSGENDWYWVKSELIKIGEWLYEEPA